MSEREVTPSEQSLQNSQFGQPIGPENEATSAVGHGSRADRSLVADDADQGQRVKYVIPLEHRPPPEMDSGGPDSRNLTEEAPTTDVGLVADEPSIWDARIDNPSPPLTEPADELLADGQEEVFSRTEVERGAIEHHSLEED
jgi:hypothetical protein